MMTKEQFDAIWSDEELQQMGVTREEWYKVHLEEEAYTNAWADRVRFTFQ
jgi:hypothetical protein